jgi:hypothetical protein
MLCKFLFLAIFSVLILAHSSHALPNATCAASHECEAKASILTVTPVFSSVVSPLDEALVASSLRFMDSPMMRPAQFPVFSSSTDEKNLASLLSTESVEGYLSSDSQTELGMF